MSSLQSETLPDGNLSDTSIDFRLTLYGSAFRGRERRDAAFFIAQNSPPLLKNNLFYRSDIRQPLPANPFRRSGFMPPLLREPGRSLCGALIAATW